MKALEYGTMSMIVGDDATNKNQECKKRHNDKTCIAGTDTNAYYKQHEC